MDMTRQADRLVVEGLRRCMAGYTTGDHGCWEMTLTLFEREIGRARACRPVSDLSFFARDLHAHGSRRLCLFPYDCPRLCQDECLAAALVSAAQADDEAALQAIADTLVTVSGRAETLFSAKALARAFAENDLVLSPIDLDHLTLEPCPFKALAARNRN